MSHIHTHYWTDQHKNGRTDEQNGPFITNLIDIKRKTLFYFNSYILLIINEFHDRHLVLVEEINMLLDICQNELSKNNSFL